MVSRTVTAPRRTETASQYVSTVAPCAAAVRATAITRRASSSIWPSQKRIPPRRSFRRTPGSRRITSCRLILRGGGSTRRRVPETARMTSPTRMPASASAPYERDIALSSGATNGSAVTRCGAVRVIKMWRSRADSQATPTSP